MESILGDLQTDPPAADGDPGETDGEVSEDEVLEDSPQAEEVDEHGETPAVQTVPLKRLNKEVARRKALEASLESLRAEVQTLKGGQRDQPAEGLEPWSPLSRDETYQTARKQVSEAEAEVRVANQLLAEMEQDPESVAEKLSRVGYRVPRNATERDLSQILNKVIGRFSAEAAEGRAEVRSRERESKAASEALRAQWQPVAAQRYPWMEDEDDARSVMARQLTSSNPWIEKLPVGKFALGAIVTELHAINLARARPAKPASAGAPRVRPGSSGSGSDPRIARGNGSAQQRFEANPSEQSLADAIEAEL